MSPPESANTLSGREIRQVCLTQEIFFDRALSGPQVRPESTCAISTEKKTISLEAMNEFSPPGEEEEKEATRWAVSSPLDTAQAAATVTSEEKPATGIASSCTTQPPSPFRSRKGHMFLVESGTCRGLTCTHTQQKVYLGDSSDPRIKVTHFESGLFVSCTHVVCEHVRIRSNLLQNDHSPGSLVIWHGRDCRLVSSENCCVWMSVGWHCS